MKRNVLFLLLIFSALFSRAYETEIIVAQDGSGDYLKIQEAIYATKAFPDKPITIYIKAGTYKEKVHIYSWNTNLSIIGDTTDQVLITNGDYFKSVDLGRNSTFHTFTMKVEANDFYARNLVIENSAGKVGQAVAIHVEADRVQFDNCTFKGNQDTMYLAGEGGRQYFRNCLVEGTTDFIFGEATVLFENCEIKSLQSSYITAASTPQGVQYGFVFKSCRLTAAQGIKDVYLGRPWRKYARTVFINCEMGPHIRPEGWKEWNSDTDGSCVYAEYASSGMGANPDKRVAWSRQLSKDEVSHYEMINVFDHWKPRAE